MLRRALMGGGGSGPPATDPYFSQRVALLHCDGADLSTAFPDVTGKTWTGTSPAQLSTTQAKFGPSSLSLLSGAGRITTPDHADFHFGTGDFMIEFWYFSAGAFGYQTPLDYGYVAAGSLLLQTGSSDGMLNLYLSGSVVCTESSPWPSSQFNFFEINRVGSTCRIFRNGVQTASGSSSASVGLSAGFNIGGTGSGGGYSSEGYLDEVRLTKGTADQHTSGYSVPTAAFPDS